MARSGWNLQVLNLAVSRLGLSENFLISGSSQAERCPVTSLGGGFSNVAMAGTVLSFLESATIVAMSMDLEAMIVPASHAACWAEVFWLSP